MIKLRLSSYGSNGQVQTRTWSFVPLFNYDGWDYDREDEASTQGTPLTRPYSKRLVHEITTSAGMLGLEANRSGMQALLDAHKIEWEREFGGKKQWMEFVLKIDASIRAERVENLNPLKRYKFSLVQKERIPFRHFNDHAYQFNDLETL